MGKDRVSVVFDPELGAIAGNWHGDQLVAVGADRSPLYPCTDIDGSANLATYVAASHLGNEVRVCAIEWLLEYGFPVRVEWMQDVDDFYRGVGEVP